MKDEIQIAILLNEIKQQLSQVKILLLVILSVVLLGFCSLVGIMNAFGAIFALFLVIALLTVPILLIIWLSTRGTVAKMDKNIENGLKSIIEKSENEQK